MLILETDGACKGNPGLASFAVIVRNGNRVVCRMSKAIGESTNNVAEWRGLIAALEYLAVHKPDAAEIRMDSKLVVQQATGWWKVKAHHLWPYKHEADKWIARLKHDGMALKIRWVPREANTDADRLAGEALAIGGGRRG